LELNRSGDGVLRQRGYKGKRFLISEDADLVLVPIPQDIPRNFEGLLSLIFLENKLHQLKKYLLQTF
jgi:hypothetical protein